MPCTINGVIRMISIRSNRAAFFSDRFFCFWLAFDLAYCIAWHFYLVYSMMILIMRGERTMRRLGIILCTVLCYRFSLVLLLRLLVVCLLATTLTFNTDSHVHSKRSSSSSHKIKNSSISLTHKEKQKTSTVLRLHD